MSHALDHLDSEYDIVIAGGGVTGAGVFNQAVQMGLKVLLVEARDFAWGTSSRSSKMVHGGLRYLKEGKFLLTRSAVRERQQLLLDYPGLITPLDFIMPLYKHSGPSPAAMKAGLSIYSFMAGKRQHQLFTREETMEKVTGIKTDGLLSSVGFMDAQVDDARLVLRLIFDACDMGGDALNYTRVMSIDRDSKGRVASIHLSDTETGKQKVIQTPVVINATGAFAEELHPSPVKGFHIRPLRGSHLVFPGHLLSLDRVISFVHPQDNRPVFLFPWEGCLFLGTTDVDHATDLNQEPCITQKEVDYLLSGLASIMPNLNLTQNEAIAAIAGVRPVLSKKNKAASKESREHVAWKDKGLVTVTGGKLTTFRLLAKDALKAAGRYLPINKKTGSSISVLEVPSLTDISLDSTTRLRIQGRYGRRVHSMEDLLIKEGSACIGSSQTLWAELEHGARAEQIRHLSDLLLRRVRVGLFLPGGGLEMINQIRAKVSPFLTWDDARWEKEIKDYQKVWDQAYSPYFK